MPIDTPAVWQLFRVRDGYRANALPGVESGALLSEWQSWRSVAGIPLGTPYLISPSFEYDPRLNSFFYSADMLGARMSTRVGYARDLKGFLNFLHLGRDGVRWSDATNEDHRAYLVWRREEPTGPRVSPATWDREVAGVDRFYRWQVSQGHIAQSPIPHRVRRAANRYGTEGAPGQTPATYSHASRREQIRWLPSRSYRQWRDVGVRGYGADGLPDPLFRGRWADRNAVFADLMVRTGMRLTEQSSLTVSELPETRAQGGYHRFWLPAAIAKAGSARWVYVPSMILRDLWAYIEVDRRVAIARAQARGLYEDPAAGYLILDERLLASPPHGPASPVRLALLTPEERRRLLIHGADGLEPAALWLGEDGAPMSTSTWKDVFRQANARCEKHGVELRAHAHMLRHTFAVLTLEQLQRGHLAALTEMNPAQRGHYTRIFGDPLDWVRRRLGHKSVTTTQVYLHALEELEMQTRMALVSDPWEDSRDARLVVNLDRRDPV